METRIEIHLTTADIEDAITLWVAEHPGGVDLVDQAQIGEHEFRLYAPRNSTQPWRAAWIPPRTKGKNRGPDTTADAGGNGKNVES